MRASVLLSFSAIHSSLVCAGHVIAVHDVHAKVDIDAGSSSIDRMSSGSFTVVDARNVSCIEHTAHVSSCDVYLDHRYVSLSSAPPSSHATTVFLHAATSGHRWQHVLRSMLFTLLQNGLLERIVVVTVGPQAAAACSLSFLTLEDVSAFFGQGSRPTLSCKSSAAPLYQREIPTLELLHSQCLLPHLHRATVTCDGPQHHSSLIYNSI